MLKNFTLRRDWLNEGPVGVYQIERNGMFVNNKTVWYCEMMIVLTWK